MPVVKIQTIDVLFMIDATGSMAHTIKAAHDRVAELAENLRRQYPTSDVRFGAICYRDPVDLATDRHEWHPFNSDVSTLVQFLHGMNATGGGDGPEDWVGAFRIALDTMEWRDGCCMIIMLSDAPAHGEQFCGYSNHDDQQQPLVEYIQRIARLGICFTGISINNGATQCFSKCRQIYNDEHGRRFSIEFMQTTSHNRHYERTFSACRMSRGAMIAHRSQLRKKTAPKIAPPTPEAASTDLGATLLDILNRTCTEIVEAVKCE